MHVSNKERKMLQLGYLVIFLLCALFLSTPSHAQDVYNFYFQKNAGPAALAAQEQLQAPPAQIQTTSAGNVSVATQPLVATPAVPELKRWELAPVVSMMAYKPESHEHDYVHSRGYGLAGGYRHNKFFMVDASAHALKMENNRSLNEFSAGVLVTPVHINFFGYEFIEWGLGAGFMTGRNMQSRWDHNSGQLNIDREAQVVQPYISTRVAFNLTDQLAITGDFRGGKFGTQSVWGLKVRF
jgi:hypothetical protein